MIELPCATPVRPAKTPVAILGVPFDPVTSDEAVLLVEQMLASRRPHYIATANVDFVVQAQRDLELRRILFDAHLVLCDGTPLVWASHWLGAPLPERVAGADLVPRLIEIAAAKGHRIFLLGATPKAAEQAAENLCQKYPNLQIAGHHSPPFSKLLEMDHVEIARRIREAKPDLLFVSFGCPKQEKWLAMNYRALEVPVAIGVGATIDFLAGHVKRAPRWMRQSGTEWIFRLMQEPRRLFKRYAADLAVFSWRFIGQWQRTRLSRYQTPALGTLVVTRREKNWELLAVAGRLDAPTLQNNALITDQIRNGTRHCWLEMSRVRSLDSMGVGWLIQLQKQLRQQNRDLILLSPSESVRRALAFMRLKDFFLTAPDYSTAQRLGENFAHEQSSPVAVRTVAASTPLIWQGEITAINADYVWTTTEHYMITLRRRELIIDLARVRFLDSSGATVMAAVKQLAARLEIRLTFTKPRLGVKSVLRHNGLESLLAAPARPKRVRTPSIGNLVLSRQT